MARGPGLDETRVAMSNAARDQAERPVTTPAPAGLAGLSQQGWLVFLIAGIALGFAALYIGDAGATLAWLSAFGYATTIAIVAGVRVHRPRHQIQWLLLAACDALTTTGVLLAPIAGGMGILGQVLTAVGSALGLAGFVLLARGRIPSGDRAALLDAAILTTGAGVLIWAFGFAPSLVVAGQSSIVVAVFFFPSLVALALVGRMWFLAGSHRPVTRLIALNVLAANGILLVEILRATLGGTALAGPDLLLRFAQLAFTGAAALHPAMDAAVEHREADIQPIGPLRFIGLSFALLVNPMTLAIEAVLGRPIDPTPYAVGGTVIGLLVIARLGESLRRLSESLGERDSLLRQLQHMAFYDALTGLPNRRLFSERLRASVRARAEDGLLATLMVDLDDFKTVNDTYGHEVGDALLVAVGERLRTAIREGDTVARLGGDEFVIALPGCTTPLIPIQVARRILTLIAQPFEVEGHALTVGASVGVAIAGMDDNSASELVRKADVAMYVAKSHGKGRFDVFDAAAQPLPTPA